MGYPIPVYPISGVPYPPGCPIRGDRVDLDRMTHACENITFPQVRISGNYNTGRIQILVLINCQAISTEIGTDSLKI